ncbi:glycosyltransferase [Granulosicoccaceae sp. 1_MG-2023]|nr:glycosyltransferase [Granulosicoccaceae sp. 1_MG-2023]
MARASHIGLLMPAVDNPGGVTVFVQAVAQALRQNGHQVRIFAVGHSHCRTEQADTYCINAAGRETRRRQLLEQIASLEKDRRFDLLVANNLQTSDFLHHSASQACKVFTLHQPSLLKRKNPFSEPRRRRRLRALFNAQHLAAVSAGYLAGFKRCYPHIAPRSEQVIYNPVDAIQLRKLSQLSVTTPAEEFIVSAGRLTRTKNHAALLRAYAQMPPDTPPLLIIGDGPLKTQLQTLAQKLGIAARVHWLGWQANPYPVIRRARLLVHSATAEAFGRVLPEALALGTPVVAFDCPYGPAEIMTGALAAYLVPLNNIAALSATMTRALQDYPAIGEAHLAPFSTARAAAAYERYL